MQEYLDFAQRHMLLVMGFVAILTMLIFTEMRRLTQAFKMVGTNDAVLLMNRGSALVLDVREAKEYSSGHLANAINIPVTTVVKRIGEITKYKDRPVLVYCRNDQRASMAARQLTKQGFDQVSVLKGGINTWTSANLPVET